MVISSDAGRMNAVDYGKLCGRARMFVPIDTTVYQGMLLGEFKVSSQKICLRCENLIDILVSNRG